MGRKKKSSFRKMARTDFPPIGHAMGSMCFTDAAPDLWSLTFPELKATHVSESNFHFEERPFLSRRQMGRIFFERKRAMGDLCKLFPDANGKWQVSNAGGDQPRWRSDGKELFYLSADSKIMAAPVKTGTNFDAGAPVPLFQANPREMVATSELFSYDVSNDGQKFLINTQLKTEATPMSVILNWNAKMNP